jgi:AcrR family transcriptional regulator
MGVGPELENLEPTKAPGRRERQAIATRQRLLEAGLDAFSRRGYHAATFDEIAEAADVARATAFNYFPRKEDIILALLQQRRDAVGPNLRHDLERDADTTTRLHDMMRTLTRLYESDAEKNRAFVRAVVQAGVVLQPPGYFDLAQIVGSVLRSGQNRGEIRADLNPDSAARLLLDGFQGIVYRWAANDPSVGSLYETLTELVDISLVGMGERRDANRDEPPSTSPEH